MEGVGLCVTRKAVGFRVNNSMTILIKVKLSTTNSVRACTVTIVCIRANLFMIVISFVNINYTSVTADVKIVFVTVLENIACIML